MNKYFQSIANEFISIYTNIISHAQRQGFSLPKIPDGDFEPNSTQAVELHKILNQPSLHKYLRNMEDGIARKIKKFISHTELREKIDLMDIFSLKEQL